MAYQPRKIPVIDLQDRKALGVKLPFIAKGVFESTYTTKEAVKTNLINYLLTGKGERFFNPTFGTSLRSQLFQNIDLNAIRSIEEEIRSSILKYFPKVVVTDLSLNAEVDAHTIYLFLKFYIRDTDIQDELTISFEQ